MDFVGMLLGTSNAIFLENMLAGKGVIQLKSSNIPGRGVMRAGEGTVRAGQNF